MTMDPERVRRRLAFLSQKAAEAMAKAESATDAGVREPWLRIAQSWQELFDQPERPDELE